MRLLFFAVLWMLGTLLASGTTRLVRGDAFPATSHIVYKTHFGWSIIDDPDAPAQPEPLAEPRYIAYESNRFLPFFSPNGFKRNAYEWQVWNTGETMHLIMDDGTLVATVPATAGIDLNLLEAWRWQNTASNVKVSIIDLGVNAHRDLTTVLPGIHYPLGGPLQYGQSDGNGHGTFIAGLVAAWPDITTAHAPGAATNLSLLGTAPFAKILPASIDSLGLNGLLIAIDWAVTSGAKVINCSWGFSGPPDGMYDACNFARSNGCVLVQAAPDSARSVDQFPDYPGSFYPALDNIVAVTSLVPTGTVATNAAWGINLLAAPGLSLVSIGKSFTNYVYGNGTSFACPMVCGVIALLMAQHPEWTHQQVLARLRSTLDPCATVQGRVNAGKALRPDNPLVKPAFQPLAMGGGGFTVDGPAVVEFSTDLSRWSFLSLVSGPTRFDVGSEGNGFFRVR